MRRREEFNYMVGVGWLRTMLGAHMCPASFPETEKSIWEHYNELVAELDATQVKIWHDMADTTLLFVRAHSLYTFTVANIQVGRSLCGRPFDIYRLCPPTVKARQRSGNFKSNLQQTP